VDPAATPDPTPATKTPRKPQTRAERLVEVIQRRPGAKGADEAPADPAPPEPSAATPNETAAADTSASAAEPEADPEPSTALTPVESRRLLDLVGDSDENVDALRLILEHGAISKTFATLKDRTKKLAIRERAVDAREKERGEGEQAWQAERAEFQRRLKAEPLAVLRENGLSVRALAEFEAGEVEQTAEQKELAELREKTAELEKRLEGGDEAAKKAAEERKRADYEALVRGAKAETAAAAMAGRESSYASLWEFAESRLDAMGKPSSPEHVAAALSEEVWTIATASNRAGKPVQRDEILGKLDREAQTWLDAVHERRSRSKDRRAPEAPASVAPQPSQPADPAPTPNSATTERGTGGSSERRKPWTNKERLQHVMAKRRQR
jgi:hypothetical protein